MVLPDLCGWFVLHTLSGGLATAWDWFILRSGNPALAMVVECLCFESGYRLVAGLVFAGMLFGNVHFADRLGVPVCECVSVSTVLLASDRWWIVRVLLGVAADADPVFPDVASSSSSSVRDRVRDLEERALASGLDLRGLVGDVGASGIRGPQAGQASASAPRTPVRGRAVHMA